MDCFICSDCGRRVTGIKYTIDKKNYCYDCYQKLIQDKQGVENQKQDLYSYIYTLFQIKELSNDMIYAIDRCIKSGKKIKAIQFTLYYYYEIEGHTRSQAVNLGYIIDNYYEAAKKYHEEIKKIQQHNKEVDINVAPITIKLTPGAVHKQSHSKKRLTKIEDL